MNKPSGVLVAFYSMSGHTRAVTEEVRDALRADADEITEPRPRRGLIGSARAMIDTTLRRFPRILAPRRDPTDYDTLVIGGPIWSGRMAAPVRTYAARYARDARQIAFFCTEESRGARDAFEDLERLCSRVPLVTLAIDKAHFPAEARRKEVKHFAAMLTLARH